MSVAGRLQHAATVIRPGRTFLRRLFDLSVTVLDHHIRLNAGVRPDPAWWHEFLLQWNGMSLLAALGEISPSVVLTSDASGSWGCGAYWSTKWFQFAWASSCCSPYANIATKELIPVVMAAAMWRRFWTGQVVSCRCDNEAVVSVINSRSSKDPSLMHLLRCLTLFEGKLSQKHLTLQGLKMSWLMRCQEITCPSSSRLFLARPCWENPSHLVRW